MGSSHGYTRQQWGSPLVKLMDCCRLGANPLYLNQYWNQYSIGPQEQASWIFNQNTEQKYFQKTDFKIPSTPCRSFFSEHDILTHWGRVMHIWVGNLTIIGSDNGLSPGWRQAIIWTNAGILLIELLGTNFSEIIIKIHMFSFKKMFLKMSSGKWRPFCLSLNVLTASTPCHQFSFQDQELCGDLCSFVFS